MAEKSEEEKKVEKHEGTQQEEGFQGEESEKEENHSESYHKETNSEEEGYEEVQESTNEEEAEAESKATEESSEEKRKKLLERAKKLKEEKVQDQIPEVEELKEKVKVKKGKDMLVPLEDYVRSGIYIGTRVVTPDMKPFVYRRRADGLAIFNTNLIDERLKEGIDYLSKFNPEDVILVCKREAGWKAVRKFGELTGVRVFTKKYPAGILTNPNLPDFFENKLTIITDSWLDRNALKDTMIVNKDVLVVCDTNNFAKGASKFIIGNNKSPKSLGLIFYLLSYGYLKAMGKDTTQVPDLDWWIGQVPEAKKVSASKGV